MPTCEECKFALFDDYGYSNYTVEGTAFHCLKKLHPDGSFDRFYGENPQLAYAATCAGFTEGEAVSIDCDRDGRKDSSAPLSDSYATDPEVKPLLDAWENSPS